MALACTLPAPAQKLPFTAEAMMSLRRISEPAISPDGRWVAFTVGTVDVAKNTTDRQIWIAPVLGGSPRPITTEGRNTRARWSPDSKRIAFLSTRSGTRQVWTMGPDGGDARQVTRIPTEADSHLWSPDGAHFVFTSEVYPDCADDACNEKRLAADKESQVKARVYTSLLYRHWTGSPRFRRRA